MRLFLVSFLALVSLMSCSKRLTPFSAQLRDEYQWSEEDMKKIQFYLSEDVVLWREANTGEARITDGAIKLRNGKKVEEFVFPKGTPGVFISEPKLNRVAIGFESGNDKYLYFGPGRRTPHYVILAPKGGKNNSVQLSYAGSIYNITEESLFARLLVDLRAAKKFSINSKRVEGRTID